MLHCVEIRPAGFFDARVASGILQLRSKLQLIPL
jgi:hypothetical protein